MSCSHKHYYNIFTLIMLSYGVNLERKTIWFFGLIFPDSESESESALLAMYVHTYKEFDSLNLSFFCCSQRTRQIK